MVKQYCCCFLLDTGVTIVGLLHINAALWYFMKWTTFTAVYSWFDLFTFLVYGVRGSVFLYGCFKDDMFATLNSRNLYFKIIWMSACALALIILLKFIVYWVDWGHFPILYFFGWIILTAFNVYHYIVLKSFANFEDQKDEDGNEV